MRHGFNGSQWMHTDKKNAPQALKNYALSQFSVDVKKSR